MANNPYFNDEEVEREIERLKGSEFVKLAKREQAIRCRRRQYMYSLRNLERKGRQLAASGITMEALDKLDADTREGEEHDRTA